MKKSITLLSLLLVIFFTSCETDFDVNAKWKDITIVYGLLNQNDTVHYIKINKAFLGSGNALQMALIPDSNLYDTAVLNVRLEGWQNNQLKVTHKLYPTTEIAKDSGTFYHPSQVLYKTNAQLDKSYLYKLFIENKKTGKIISSETPLVQDVSIERPMGVWVNMNSDKETKAVFYSGKGGRLYQLVVRFHYKELEESSLDTIYRYVDLSFGEKKSNDLSGGDKMEIPYTPSDFFDRVNNLILNNTSAPYNPASVRFVGKVEFIIYVIGDELNTYIEVNGPATGVLMDKPDYTNIENGIGVFSCRYSTSKSLNLTAETITRLKTYEPLHFQ